MFRCLPGLLVLLFTSAVLGKNCDQSSLLALPDVTIDDITTEKAPVMHCKVAGVIGAEIHFELLLPERWNGKFVMGGGGGFVTPGYDSDG